MRAFVCACACRACILRNPALFCTKLWLQSKGSPCSCHRLLLLLLLVKGDAGAGKRHHHHWPRGERGICRRAARLHSPRRSRDGAVSSVARRAHVGGEVAGGDADEGSSVVGHQTPALPRKQRKTLNSLC